MRRRNLHLVVGLSLLGACNGASENGEPAHSPSAELVQSSASVGATAEAADPKVTSTGFPLGPTRPDVQGKGPPRLPPAPSAPQFVNKVENKPLKPSLARPLAPAPAIDAVIAAKYARFQAELAKAAPSIAGLPDSDREAQVAQLKSRIILGQ